VDDQVTLFETAGGQAFFDRLVTLFYDGVAADPLLRPMYPEDLTGPRRHLAMFLGQYWGGPSAYQEERGHPRLRMRHAPFPIDVEARDRWLTHMRGAVDAMDPEPTVRTALLEYFDYAADSLRNVAEDTP
jgi:hemoglobin